LIAEYLIHRHGEWDQVDKDVDRSLWKLIENKHTRDMKRRELATLLHALLSKSALVDEPHEQLKYYQGLHDVASVLLLECDDLPLAFALLDRLARTHLRVRDLQLFLVHHSPLCVCRTFVAVRRICCNFKCT
jgi:hypothetical protein